MARYSVHVFCDECSVPHPMGISIELGDGPVDKRSIGDTYKGRDLPPQVAMLVNNTTRCPTTGKIILQRDNDQVFLVPESSTDLWNQLGNAVSMAAKEDQIVWTIFGVFWAANAVLLVALFTTGAVPSPPVGIVVCASGAALSLVWFLIQRRAIRWLGYYERIIRDLEEKHLQIPNVVALTPGLNEATFNETVGRGVRVRPLMTGSGLVLALLWIAALAWFVCRLTRACS